jgi:hypothetical protein
MKSNADTELDLQAVKHAFSLGKSKPVKARIVDRKINDLWTKFDERVINISQFLDLACNFFEPDRDLPRPTFDTSARPARRGNARRRRQLQPSGALPDDANGTICYYDFRPSAFNVKLIIFILIAIVIRQDDSLTNDSSSQLQSIDTTANQWDGSLLIATIPQ